LALALEFPFKELTDLIPETADECRPPSLIMNRVLKLAFAQVFLLSPVADWADTPETTTAVEQPTNPTLPWQITVGRRGWLTGVSGHIGSQGVNPYVNVGFGQIMSSAARPLMDSDEADGSAGIYERKGFKIAQPQPVLHATSPKKRPIESRCK